MYWWKFWTDSRCSSSVCSLCSNHFDRFLRWYVLYLHRVSKKTVQNCFCQNFFKFPPILIIFGRKMAKRLKLYEVHSFFTSANLHHHTTVLNAGVPNCYAMPKVLHIRLLKIASLIQ